MKGPRGKTALVAVAAAGVGALPEGFSNMELGDVVAIVVSRAETTLNDSLKTAKDSYKIATEDLKKAQEAVEKARIDALTTGPIGEKVTALRVAFSALSKHRIDVIACDGNDNDALIKGTVRIFSPCGQWVQFNMPVETLFPTGWTTLKATVETSKKKVTDLQTEIAKLKTKLANIPQLERRARAKIAERSLGQTAKGKELIELITGNLDQEIKILAE